MPKRTIDQENYNKHLFAAMRVLREVAKVQGTITLQHFQLVAKLFSLPTESLRAVYTMGEVTEAEGE